MRKTQNVTRMTSADGQSGQAIMLPRFFMLASIFFVAAGICTLCWAVGRGGLPLRSIEAPLRLADGESLTFRFSMIQSSNHYVEIAVPDTSADLRSALLEISGNVRLMADGQSLTQTDLPSSVRHTQGNAAVVVLEFHSSPLTPYTLVTKLNRVPEAVAGKEGKVKVELASYEIEEVGLIFYSGVACLILGAGLGVVAARREKRKHSL